MPRTLAQNAQYIAETIKPAIKSAIEAQGVTVPSTDSFLDYADRIGEIEGGGSGYQLKDLPTGSISTVNDAAELPLNALKVSVEAWQEGSGDPSPSNVRPIHGWSSANIKVGVNMVDWDKISFKSGYFINSAGNEQSNTSYKYTIDYIDVKPNTTYCIQAYYNSVSDLAITVPFYDNQKNFISRDLVVVTSGIGTFGGQFTTPNNCHYVRFSFSRSSRDYCMEVGDTVHDYNAFNHTYTHAFTDSQGNPLTVYGAEWDVVKGELKQTDGYIASYNGETLPSTWISDRDVYASGTTPTTGAEVVYKLATPTTINQQPLSIRLLEGTNNLYADCGEVIEGEYFIDEGVHRYQLYDYIESDGTQCIDLGFAPENGATVTTSFVLLSTQTSEAFVYGATDNSAWLGFAQNPASHNTIYENNTSGRSESYIQNQQYLLTLTASRDYTNHLCMFGFYLNGYAPGIKTRLCYCKYNDNFYLPAKRKSDGVFGLYDVANQAFLTDSAGGNAFVGGNPTGVEV